MEKLLLVAVRTDLVDVSLPVRDLLEAVGRHGGPPAHVSVFSIEEATEMRDQLAGVFSADNPDAFMVV